MSENEDDDRMDRAERIRQMREGSGRDDDAEDGSETAEASGDDTETDPAADDSGEPEPEKTQPEKPADSGTDDDSSPESDHNGEEDNTTPDPGPAGDEWVSGADKMQANNQDDTDESDGERNPAEAVPETSDLDAQDDEATAPETEDNVSAPLPGSDQLEKALDKQEAESDTETVASEEVAGADAGGTADVLDGEEVYEEETRVLEFQLGDEYYCLDIEYIEEIVKQEAITRVPNTPEFVEGVVDLRGQITTILNPKVTIEKEDTTAGDLIIVFDSVSFEDQGHVGWIVDDVRQVSPITDNEVSEPPVDEKYINGVIDRGDDEQFVIWTTPEMAMEEAE